MKRIISIILATALLTQGLYADEQGDSIDTPKEPRHVGKAATDGTSSAKKQQWQAIGLAIGVVAIAVAALIIVGDKHDHHNHHGNSHKH